MVWEYRVKKQSKQWLNLSGELSHEYFPKLYNNEQYLVVGANEGGRDAHEQKLESRRVANA